MLQLPSSLIPALPSPALGDYHILDISVRNSVNPQRGHVFSKQLLESVYTFGSYFGSKRFYKINRGALGDASKLMLGAPYALADSMNIHLTDIGIYYPITHRTSSTIIYSRHFELAYRLLRALEIIEGDDESLKKILQRCKFCYQSRVALIIIHIHSTGSVRLHTSKYAYWVYSQSTGGIRRKTVPSDTAHD